MSIRIATQVDASAITLVQRRSWAAEYPLPLVKSMLGALEQKQHQRLWQQRLALPSTRTWVVDDKGVKGFACVQQLSEQNAELLACYLMPNYIGVGLGARLLSEIDAQRNSSWQTLHLWVMSDNHRAIGFYRHLGFRFSGISRELAFEGMNYQQIRGEKVYESEIA